MRRASTIIAAGIAAGAGLLAATPLAADEWTDQVRGLIDAAAETYTSSGYDYGSFFHEGSLDDDGSERLTIRLSSNRETQLIGACDTDCSDLDLTLYDPAGKEVDADLELDDFPIVSASPSRDGIYTVVVQMAVCGVEPCHYAVQQFVK